MPSLPPKATDNIFSKQVPNLTERQCFHCGEPLPAQPVAYDDKSFCCSGCSTVYQVLYKAGMCAYYNTQPHPGINQRSPVRHDKFAFLDHETIRNQLIQFSHEGRARVSFHLPQMHCSSCLWLLEHLHDLHPGIYYSRVDFAAKEVAILFDEKEPGLRGVAELLTSIGYEPYIALHQLNKKPSAFWGRQRILKLAVAGFCFSNIMLLAFPEYLGLEGMEDHANLVPAFRYLSLALSLPVLLYSASEFFVSGWKGLRNRYLNIDAPIALAIAITFGRSVYEILSGTGSGYLDSMSGIVFFMLVGRLLQDGTRQKLTFDRDYTAYFPIAVNRLDGIEEKPTPLPELQAEDHVVIYPEEIVPADGMLIQGKAEIDYSFVTGESMPVHPAMGELVYAGARQKGGKITLRLVKPVNQSYLTSLWNRDSMQHEGQTAPSWVDALARYFTYILFGLVAGAALYWWANDPSKIWPSVTAALIVACPCALLLSNTFTNAHIIRMMDKAGMYVRHAGVVERMCQLRHLVFDKTGTITQPDAMAFEAVGTALTHQQKLLLASAAAQSQHPISRRLVQWLGAAPQPHVQATEYTGFGVEALINGHTVRLGSPVFITGQEADANEPWVMWQIDQGPARRIRVRHQVRPQLEPMLQWAGKRFKLSLLSGDHDAERQSLEKWMPQGTNLLFRQSPADKLDYVEHWQKQQQPVMMVGDGLNDAGALKAAYVGIAVTENTNRFTPGSDAIMLASQMPILHRLIQLARAGRFTVYACFVFSLLYNVVGLSIALQGNMNPMIAAILMPSSSVSIMLLSWLGAVIAARRLIPPGLRPKTISDINHKTG